MAVTIDETISDEHPWIYEEHGSIRVLLTNRVLCLRKNGESLTLMDEEVKQLKDILSRHPLKREE